MGYFGLVGDVQVWLTIGCFAIFVGTILDHQSDTLGVSFPNGSKESSDAKFVSRIDIGTSTDEVFDDLFLSIVRGVVDRRSSFNGRIDIYILLLSNEEEEEGNVRRKTRQV